MKKITIEYQSAWHKPEVFETSNIKDAIQICEYGVNQQYIVLIDGKRYRPLNSYGRKVELWNNIKLICIKYQLQKYTGPNNTGPIGSSIDYQYPKRSRLQFLKIF